MRKQILKLKYHLKAKQIFIIISSILLVVIVSSDFLKIYDTSNLSTHRASISIFGYELLIDPQTNTCLQNHHIFLLKRQDNLSTPKVNELWAFNAGYTGFFPKGQLMLKKIVGIPGDHIEVNSDGVFVNNKLVAKGLKVAFNLKADARKFYRKQVLKDHEYFVVGDSESSFDSRYFGTVNQNSFIGRAFVIY